MSLRPIWPALLLLAAHAAAQDSIGLAPGQVITKSAKVKPGTKVTLPPGPAMNCITVRGNDITIDFADAYIRAQKDVWHNRENFNGTGLWIDGSKNVTIRNLNVQGFKYNIRVTNSENVRIENCDVSFSHAIKMDGNTFLNLRDAEVWRGYGAGVWLEKSTGCKIERVYGTGGMIGVAMLDTSNSTVHNCDFSFNSAWGVALARSSDNVISWNHTDFVNRTWGGGWGGDSSAVAVADDSDRNYFVGNSMTHGGDGFFLSNRNDVGPVNAQGYFTPLGGSDHNVVAYNDGSWSPNNAFEGTFSDGNVYIGNQANWSGYGFWLGFSTNTLILQNTIRDNRNDGIALEQGKGTRIEGNTLERNRNIAIHLWGGSEKAREPFPSTLIDIVENLIADSARAYDLTGSTDVVVARDKLVRAPVTEFKFSTRPAGAPLAQFKLTPDYAKLQSIVARKPADFKMYSEQRMPKGVQWLQPAEYGPDDFRGELAAWRQVDPGMIELYLIQEGVKVSGQDWTDFEDTPDDPRFVRVVPKPTDSSDGEEKAVEITLTSKDGKQTQKINGRLRTAVWNLKWYSWRGLTYDDAVAWNNLLGTNPIKTEQSRSLGGDWSGRSPSEGVPSSNFALVATTRVTVPAGRYLLSTVSDDGIKVFVDGRVVISRWNHHGPTPDNVPVDLDGAPHNIRVEYCQEDGAAVLRLDWKKI